MADKDGDGVISKKELDEAKAKVEGGWLRRWRLRNRFRWGGLEYLYTIFQRQFVYTILQARWP